MKSKRTTPARPGARKPAASRRPPVPNPFPLATRRLAKRLLQFAELPEPERTRAYNAWLNSAGTPKRNADRQNQVREFYSLMKAIAKKLSPRDRSSMRALGNQILAKASRKAPPKADADVASPHEISRFLEQVHRDWEATRDQFPNNTKPPSQWPIPFFGNPATAQVATIGVNPSSGEFTPDRLWESVKTKTDWKLRLRDYFRYKIPPHEWFDPWRTGLAVLGLSYEDGSAVHLDLSYRATTAMLRNPGTDLAEFRRMVEHDADHFFRLLHFCPNLRLLLTFGPIPTEKPGRPESLFGHLFTAAEARGFRQIKDQDSWKLWHEPTGRVYVVHDADTPGEKCITCRVVKNLFENRDALRAHLAPQAPSP